MLNSKNHAEFVDILVEPLTRVFSAHCKSAHKLFDVYCILGDLAKVSVRHVVTQTARSRLIDHMMRDRRVSVGREPSRRNENALDCESVTLLLLILL